jgi:hypothetical protein
LHSTRSLPVAFPRSVVLFGYSGFFHHWNWLPSYSWNIAESGAKQQKLNSNWVGTTFLGNNQKCGIAIDICDGNDLYFPPPSCVPDLASFFGLSILDCLFGFLWRLYISRNIRQYFHKYVLSFLMERNGLILKTTFTSNFRHLVYSWAKTLWNSKLCI